MEIELQPLMQPVAKWDTKIADGPYAGLTVGLAQREAILHLITKYREELQNQLERLGNIFTSITRLKEITPIESQLWLVSLSDCQLVSSGRALDAINELVDISTHRLDAELK